MGAKWLNGSCLLRLRQRKAKADGYVFQTDLSDSPLIGSVGWRGVEPLTLFDCKHHA